MANESKRDGLTRKVTLVGLADVMFDRYAGDNKTQLPPEDKLYFAPDGRTIVLPAANISSLLTAQNTPSAPKRFLDARTYKKTAQGILSYTVIQPHQIPFLRNGRPIEFGAFDGDSDALSGAYIHRSVARLDKGIPNPKVRPVLPLPWSLEFDFRYFENDEVTEEMVRSLLIRGGLSIGVGTFRGVFGKFSVAGWE
ncbi:MAG: hypothetical protein FJ280_29810 [Planctomycetes bacterium]|nr:hypothetical protein [Planctomycetota bacterium]